MEHGKQANIGFITDKWSLDRALLLETIFFQLFIFIGHFEKFVASSGTHASFIHDSCHFKMASSRRSCRS
jgi:hypothetical protein